MNLKDVSTRELVEELKCREGVIAKTQGAYDDDEYYFEGPCIILYIKD